MSFSAGRFSDAAAFRRSRHDTLRQAGVAARRQATSFRRMSSRTAASSCRLFQLIFATMPIDDITDSPEKLRFHADDCAARHEMRQPRHTAASHDGCRASHSPPCLFHATITHHCFISHYVKAFSQSPGADGSHFFLFQSRFAGIARLVSAADIFFAFTAGFAMAFFTSAYAARYAEAFAFAFRFIAALSPFPRAPFGAPPFAAIFRLSPATYWPQVSFFSQLRISGCSISQFAVEAPYGVYCAAARLVV